MQPLRAGDHGIIPAYAGSTGASSAPGDAEADHPRIRGEHCVRESVPRTVQGSSPHTRGAREFVDRERFAARIIPAYAGSTNFDRLLYYDTEDHPRIRGEHSSPSTSRRTSWGSSPHTRGAPPCPSGWRRTTRIIPAYAGSTDEAIPMKRGSRDHPRIRGEHPLERHAVAVDQGSSPHTRGALRRNVGNPWTGTDHPRIRGEHGVHGACRAAHLGSSPHTRGALRGPPGLGRAVLDHPRIRGEHTMTPQSSSVARGSSPHTRGAPSHAP